MANLCGQTVRARRANIASVKSGASDTSELIVAGRGRNAKE
jgi:hypothetical protein